MSKLSEYLKHIFSSLKQLNESYDNMLNRYKSEYEVAEEKLVNRILEEADKRLTKEIKNLNPEKMNPGDVAIGLNIDFTKWKERKEYTKYIHFSEDAVQKALDATQSKYLLTGVIILAFHVDGMGGYKFYARVKITDTSMVIKNGTYES